MSEPKNKGGRPRKYPVGPRTNLTVRLPTSLRDRIRAAAQGDGRSLAEMIERACEAHLAGQDQRTIIREEIRAALADPQRSNETIFTPCDYDPLLSELRTVRLSDFGIGYDPERGFFGAVRKS